MSSAPLLSLAEPPGDWFSIVHSWKVPSEKGWQFRTEKRGRGRKTGNKETEGGLAGNEDKGAKEGIRKTQEIGNKEERGKHGIRERE